VEDKQCVVTNHDYKIIQEIDDESTELKSKIGSIIFPSDFYRHVALFFEELGPSELLAIPILLQGYIDKDEFKYLKIEGKIVYEDNREFKNEDILFTGKIYIEANILNISKAEAHKILNQYNIRYKDRKLSFSIRDNMNWKDLDKSERPTIFLCHDSRDKKSVEELYFALTRKSINVWFDKYSLEIGDSLTENIAKGLEEANHGIIFISKNFLSNDKWVKFELQTLMSKQIYTKEKTILPIWLDIEEKDLERHHWLREKVAVKFSEGIDVVSNKIISAIKK
jgi:hypothetical protein